MNKLIAVILAAAALAAPVAEAKDNKASKLFDALGKMATNSSDSTSADDSNGGLLGQLGGFLNNLGQSKNFSLDDLIGTWNYTGPAVTFESDNALMKVGGAGAAVTVEEKLEPYYKKLGVTKASITVDAEHNFTMKIGLVPLKGVVEKAEDGAIYFRFKAFGKASLGSVHTNVTMAANQLNITFEATKMVKILTTVASKVNSSSVKALGDLLDKYDGIYMGFKMKKAAEKQN